MNWQNIVQDFIIKHSDRIRQATKPLRDHLDVVYFTYHRIDPEGKYTVLVDRPDWAERYVEQKLYLEDPYLRHPDRYRSGICAMLSNGTDAFRKKLILEGKDVFGAGDALFDSLFLIEKNGGSVEFFGFAGKEGSSRLTDTALNRTSYLRAFTAHFKRELKPILQPMEEGSSPLTQLKGTDFFNTEPIHTDPKTDLKKYLEEIGLKYLVDAVAVLSPQERKCLAHLARGKTAKETAAAMRLSSRTIESYLAHIKNKLDCRDLLDLARQLAQFHLLP